MATTYLEYPSTLKGDTVQHWISFKAFDFKAKGTQTLDIALYIPSDALQTSYKSSYEAASLGALGGAAKQKSMDLDYCGAARRRQIFFVSSLDLTRFPLHFRGI